MEDRVCRLTLPKPRVVARGASSPPPTFSHQDTQEGSGQRGEAVGGQAQPGRQGACSLRIGVPRRSPRPGPAPAPPALPPPPRTSPPRGTRCLFPLIFPFLFGGFGVGFFLVLFCLPENTAPVPAPWPTSRADNHTLPLQPPDPAPLCGSQGTRILSAPRLGVQPAAATRQQAGSAYQPPPNSARLFSGLRSAARACKIGPLNQRWEPTPRRLLFNGAPPCTRSAASPKGCQAPRPCSMRSLGSHRPAPHLAALRDPRNPTPPSPPK